MKVTKYNKILGGIIFGVIVVCLVVIIRSQYSALSAGFKLNESGYTYVIHGVSNYDTGSTYYLYKDSSDKREVILVDPESPVNFRHLTDRKVTINGTILRNSRGVEMVRITWVERAD